MTIAMILTTAISLGLLGGGLIVARMTDQMRELYGDKVEVTVYLTPRPVGATPTAGRRRVRHIKSCCRPARRREHRVSRARRQALERYKQQFAGQPEMLEIGTPEALSGVVPGQARTTRSAIG